MSRNDELKERVRKRLALIEATKDSGVYAQHYVEDASALIEALEAEETQVRAPDRNSIC